MSSMNPLFHNEGERERERGVLSQKQSLAACLLFADTVKRLSVYPVT